MWTTRLLLSISLLGLFYGAKSQPAAKMVMPIAPQNPSGHDTLDVSKENSNMKFFMTTFAALKSDQKGHACFFCQSTDILNFALNLEFLERSFYAMSEQVEANSTFFGCGEFRVPSVNNTQLAYMSLRINGEEKKRKTVALVQNRESCHVQMQKSMFKPNETVKCRMFCIDSNLKPTDPGVVNVYLRDYQGARIDRIQNPTAKHGLVSMQFHLSDCAHPGWYWLEIQRKSGEIVTQYFQLKRYDVPRFSTKFTCPSAISVLEKDVKIQLSSEYVYDKALDGNVIGKCCRRVKYTATRERNCLWGLEDICMTFNEKLVNGSCTIALSLKDFYLQFSEYDDSIQCEVTTKEKGTEATETKSCYMYITRQPASLLFESPMSPYFMRGIDLPVSVRLIDQNRQPIGSQNLTIEVEGKLMKTATTDKDGRVKCSLDTTSFRTQNITIRVSYPNEDQCYTAEQYRHWYTYSYHEYPTAEMTVYGVYSEGDCYVQIQQIQDKCPCNQDQVIIVNYSLTQDGVGEGANEATFVYMCKAGGSHVCHGKHTVDLTRGMKGTFNITVSINHKNVPRTELLVLGVMHSSIISDKIEMTVESCFENKVLSNFKEPVVRPGSEAHQVISAAPDSICGIGMRDKSLDLISSSNDITADTIHYSVMHGHYGYQVDSYNLEEGPPPCVNPNQEELCNGKFFVLAPMSSLKDTYSVLRDFGLMIEGSYNTRKPELCGQETHNRPVPLFADAGFATTALRKSNSGAGASGSNAQETIRKNWLDAVGWDIVPIGTNGTATVTFAMADAITKWSGKVLCLSPTKGVGLSMEPAEVQTMLTFFVEASLPNNCISGESPVITVTVVNYMPGCHKVATIVRASDGSRLERQGGTADDGCVSEGGRMSMEWILYTSTIGKINITASASTTVNGTFYNDTVIMSMDVQPRGIKQECAFTHLLNANNSDSSIEVNIERPGELVNDSSELRVTVVGRPVIPGVGNLDKLLNQPSGTCEQNADKLISIQTFLEFFKAVNDSASNALVLQAQQVLTNVYNQVVACSMLNGGFSGFLNTPTLNMRTTLDMFGAFEKMKDMVYVNEERQQKTLALVGNQQNLTTGCFHFNEPMYFFLDNYNAGMLWTSYVITRLHNYTSYGIGPTIVDGAKKCIQNADLDSLDTLVLAHMFYAATKTKQNTLWNQIYPIAMGRAISKGNTVCWTPDGHPAARQYYFSTRCSSEAVVATAYMMMGILKGPNPIHELADLLARGAQWMSNCQDSNGFYSSSRATPVAIEAMIEYARSFDGLQSPDAKIAVTVGGNVVAEFTVNESNEMLVQSKNLPGVHGIYRISFQGKGRPTFQINHEFYTEITKQESPLALTVVTRAPSCAEEIIRTFNSTICTSYNGNQSQSGPLVVTARSPTGFYIAQGPVYKALSTDKVCDVKFADPITYFYLPPLKRGEKRCFSFTSYLQQRASRIQNSTVTVHDSDNPGNAAYAEYRYPCPKVSEE